MVLGQEEERHRAVYLKAVFGIAHLIWFQRGPAF